MQLISRDGRQALDRVLNATDQHLLLCAPYITSTEMTRVIRILQAKVGFSQLSIHVITDLQPNSILGGSLDIRALLDLFDSGCGRVDVTALPRVHAKAYVADANLAWITSANLTTSALDYNFEYGVLIEEPKTTAKILNDLSDYAKLGAVATRLQIQNYATAVETLRQDYELHQKTSERTFRQRFREQLEQVSIEALRLQVGTRSPLAVFADAITFLLRSGPMSTKAMHPRIQELLPDLCDDRYDRIIDNKHFGKLWKHHVRTAQQHLKRAGIIAYRGGFWMLATGHSD